ncbi:MAG: (2Fe-2S)-binding protein [Acidobacteriota bacterium]|nr:(2Fe-2S)-binding protein [Acidobacteriota bacterium]
MEAELIFEREDIKGVAVVGTYLIDSARRLGIEIIDECGRLGLCDSCAVTIKSGAEFLTAPTKAEIELLSDERRKNGERLSCQAKIESIGEIVVVTKKKADDSELKDANEEYRKEFADLPLEKKIANLLQLEAMTLSETFTFILNSPYKIVGKVMDVMAEFGLKMEDETKNATRPDEHKTAETSENGDKSKKTEKAEKKSKNKNAETTVAAEEKS